jgi:hypothetical protein
MPLHHQNVVRFDVCVSDRVCSSFVVQEIQTPVTKIMPKKSVCTSKSKEQNAQKHYLNVNQQDARRHSQNLPAQLQDNVRHFCFWQGLF